MPNPLCTCEPGYYSLGCPIEDHSSRVFEALIREAVNRFGEEALTDPTWEGDTGRPDTEEATSE